MTKLFAREAEEVVRGAIVQVAPDLVEALASVDPADDLWDVLELDSMDHQNIMVEIFERTGVEIAERDYPMLRSLDRLAEHLSTFSR
ncbi:MAG: acyl carrier protein [Actinomycetia bacterium]|nr:acyl carrier protein [Actinomycetes bacterium]MCP4223152.1 acyl carrier protein [Actinomycetes bacterium]MCP5031619.1 acyl carrier protein [Actinomycetes bacterium]